MQLYLMRHGDALHSAMDSARRLSPKGRADVSKIAAALKQKGVRPERIWHSPKERAVETAGIVAKTLGVEQFDSVPEIEPESSPELIYLRLEALANKIGGSLMMVSHLPFLPKLMGRLLADRTRASDFGTACVTHLEAYEGGWAISWSLNPRHL